jgi:hypothetical protein
VGWHRCQCGAPPESRAGSSVPPSQVSPLPPRWPGCAACVATLCELRLRPDAAVRRVALAENAPGSRRLTTTLMACQQGLPFPPRLPGGEGRVAGNSETCGRQRDAPGVLLAAHASEFASLDRRRSSARCFLLLIDAGTAPVTVGQRSRSRRRRGPAARRARQGEGLRAEAVPRGRSRLPWLRRQRWSG